MKRLVLAVGLLLGIAAAPAYAQCPVPNSYPFTAGCPLPAAELNAAIEGRMAVDGGNAKLPEAQDNLGIGRNVKSYGAKCDGVTDDTAAINALFAEARASVAATPRLVVVEGLANNVSNKECRVTSLNATGFTGPAFGRMLIKDLSIVCSGSTNICLDTTGSINVEYSNVTIRGDSSGSPKIGLQQANTHTSAVCCIQTNSNGLQILGSFRFAALYNMGSESSSYYGAVFQNSFGSSGPIMTLGTITGGSGYVNGTYAGVPLTGGFGTGALGTITVSGGAVTSVFVSYEGHNYQTGNVLSASAVNLGGAGSGFSVPVATALPFVVVMDGQNHWRAASAFNPITQTPDTNISFSQNNFYGGSIRNYGGGHALWLNNTHGLHFYRTYVYSTSGCGAVLFDSGAAGTTNKGLYADMVFELTNLNSWCIGGGNANPIIDNMTYRSTLDFASASVFGAASNVSTVSFKGAKIAIDQFANAPALWSDPAKFNVSADIYLPSAAPWAVPNTFSGTVCDKDCRIFTGKPLLVGPSASTAVDLGSGDMIVAQDNANGTRQIHMRNLSTGVSALSRLTIGNDTSANQTTITVNGSGNVGGSGAGSTTYNSIGKSCFAFNTTNGLCLIAGGVLQVLGTPTSCASQPTGAVWNDVGTLKVCP